MNRTVPAQPRTFAHAPSTSVTIAQMVDLVNREITVNLISRAIYAIGGKS